MYVPLPFKPETNESDPQPQPIVDMIRTVAEASDAVFRSQIAQFLDLAKFVRHIAIEVFLGDGDGFVGNWGMNNFYFYRLEERESVHDDSLGQERDVPRRSDLSDLSQHLRRAGIDTKPAGDQGACPTKT